MITAGQVRAARAFLDWKQSDLAKAAGISEMSVKNVERGVKDLRTSTLRAVQSALEIGGVEFISDNGSGAGVRLRKLQTVQPPALEGEAGIIESSDM